MGTVKYYFFMSGKKGASKLISGLQGQLKTTYDTTTDCIARIYSNNNATVYAKTSRGNVKYDKEFPSYILNAVTLDSVELEITLKTSANNTDYFGANVYIANQPIEGSAQTIYERCNSGSLLGTYYLGSNQSSKKSFTITNFTLIKNLMDYGICISPVGEASASTSDSINDSISIISNFVTLTYSSATAPPQIDIVSPETVKGFYTFAAKPIVNPLNIKWTYEQSLDTPAKKFELYYLQKNGVDEETMIASISGNSREYIIDPITFPELNNNSDNASAKISLRGYVTDDIYTERTADVFLLPIECEILSPNNAEIILSQETNTLKWDIIAVKSENLADEYYTDDSFEVTNYPSHFDIQISTNGGESWNDIAINAEVERISGVYSYIIPPNTLKNGINHWRIRAYINGYTIDNYKSDIFLVRVQASTSSVTCDGKPIPTLSWQSSAQVAYQVRFADYDSGAIYGTATSHTVPYFYADGNYPVQVRTQASNGEWSDWTEIEYVAITNSAPSNQVGLTITPTRHAVVADWTDSGVSDNYILYRNGIPIYIGNDKNYTDIAANGKCTYFVRAVAGEYYSQSNAVTVSAYPKADCIYDFSSVTWIPLKFSLSPRSRIYSKSSNVVYNHYAGRDKPIAFTAGHNTRQMSGNYVLKTRDEALRISDLSGKRVVFKDTRGGIIIGILNNVNINVNPKLYSVTFTVTETDYKEAVEYAAT